MIQHYDIILKGYPRGYHLITQKILDSIPALPQSGLMNIFVKHSSAGLTINENADPTVRQDFETSINRLFPEDLSLYRHRFEGEDDMPAHLKSSIIGTSVTIPVREGRLDMGTWQGIYFCEFRNHASSRKIVVTIYY